MSKYVMGSSFIVRVSFTGAPIPIRDMDWEAHIDGYEEDGSSMGRTPAIALRDLAERIEEGEFDE